LSGQVCWSAVVLQKEKRNFTKKRNHLPCVEVLSNTKRKILGIVGRGSI
jgi:hypothetical protein